ncbi:MAG TPA: hypothetical protein VGH44_03035 [Candidatus Saccharimonadia bacterium]|jgi:hypothetical protein
MTEKDEITQLHNALMPVLAQASIGAFDNEIAIDPRNSRRVNELLMGVEVLLEVIRQKDSELMKLRAEQPAAVQHTATTSLLDEILKQPPE